MKFRKIMINTSKKKIIIFFISTLLFLILVFGRNFTGIYLFNYRVGEIIVGIQILLTHYIIFSAISNNLKYIHGFFLILFYLKLYYIILDLNDFYIFRFSSTLWSFSMFSLGYKYNISKETYFKILSTSLVLLYILNYIYYPIFFLEFFSAYSDKFDFTKPSDLLLIFCLMNFIAFKTYNFKTFITIFSISSLFYFPIFINQSRGTFIAIVITSFYITSKLLIKKFNVKSNLLTSLVLVLVLLIFIILFINNLQTSTFSYTQITSKNFSIEFEKINQNLGLFYFDRGYLTSSDQDINWRLLLWQTTLKDMYQEKLLIYGYPINQELPIFNHPYYKTTNLENFNLHNFIVQFFAYFGSIGLILLIIFFIEIIKMYYKKYKSLDLAFLIIPVFLVSFFDSSMESVRFPFLFFYSLGLLINSKDL